MAVDWPSWWLVLLSLDPPLLKLCLHLLDLFALRSPQLQMLHFFSLALQPIRVLVWFAFPLFLCSGSWFSGLMESGVCLDNCSILTLDNFLSVYRKRAVGCKPFSFSWLQTSQHFCFKVSLLLTHAIFLPIPFSLDHLQNDWHDWNKWRASLKLAMLTSCPFPLFLFSLC